MNGELVASAAELEGAGLLIEPLARELETARGRSERLAKLKGSKEPSRTMVTIQGDRELEFRILQRVMFTLSQTGYPDVSLAVIKDV
jgi:biopolymer transport protein ExbD